MENYLRIENNSFGFVVAGIHDILQTDIEITNEEYNNFFKLQGKQFKLKKNPTGTSLFDYIEEYVVEPVLTNKDTSQEEFLIDLDFRVSKMELGV